MSGSFEDQLGSLYSGVKQFSEVIAVEKGATIAKATVYNPGCEVTWLLPFTPSSTGLGEILLTGLPSNINADTVRATLFEGDAIILEVVTESAVIPNGPDDYIVDDPERELENLKKMLRAAHDNKEGYTKQVKMLEDYIAMVEKLPLSCKNPKLFTELIGDGNVASFMEALENTQNTLFETHNKIFEVDQEIAEIKRRQEVIQLQSRSPKSSKTCYNLSIQIFAQSTSPVQIHVSYLDPRASWLPSYDVRSNPDTHTLDITYYGVVKQTTGYDWKNINMFLSTATPSTAGSPPKLEPAILNLQPPARLFMKRLGSANTQRSLDVRAEEAKECEYAMEDEEDGDDDGCGGGAAPMEVMVSDVVDNVTSSTFGIPRLVNLDSEDKDHKVTIAIINLEATIKYKVYPKISLHTFLKASSKNTSKFPLLLGSAKIFHGNNYICETTLKQINPEEKFSVFLGVDDSIKIVSRDPKQFGQVHSSLFSKTYTTSVESITEINNTRLFPVDVDVHDQLPLSQKTAIKVKMIEPKSESDAIKFDAKRGRIKWHLTIPALQHHTIKFAYEIEYPPGSLQVVNTV